LNSDLGLDSRVLRPNGRRIRVPLEDVSHERLIRDHHLPGAMVVVQPQHQDHDQQHWEKIKFRFKLQGWDSLTFKLSAVYFNLGRIELEIKGGKTLGN